MSKHNKMQSRYNLYLEQFFKLPKKYASTSRLMLTTEAACYTKPYI